MEKKDYNRDESTQDCIEKFKTHLLELEAQKETLHPVRYKLLVNSTNAMIADLEAQLAGKCNIVVNGKEHVCYEAEVGYQEIFRFAYGKWPTTAYEKEFSLAYSNPGRNTGGGTIGFLRDDRENEMVVPKEGMIFDIIHT